MILQIIGLDGRILALLTSKRFFSTVCELVCFQILNFSAGVVALVTPEWLFPRTNGSASLSRGEKLLWRSRCTCLRKASLHCEPGCVSLGHQFLWRSSCTVCIQKASLHCEPWCVSLGHYLLCRISCTASNWRIFLINVFSCVSWGKKLLCRRIRSVFSWKASLLNGLSCDS